MGVPFRRVAPPIHWESVPGSPLGVEDHHPRAGGPYGGSPGRACWGFVLRAVLHVIIWVLLGVVCVCLAVPGNLPGTAVTVWRVRVRRYCARVVGLPETRARVCVWCSMVLVGACAVGPIRGVYRVGASYFGHAARNSGWSVESIGQDKSRAPVGTAGDVVKGP